MGFGGRFGGVVGGEERIWSGSGFPPGRDMWNRERLRLDEDVVRLLWLHADFW